MDYDHSPSSPSPRSGRLAALHRYGILDTPPEAAYDRLTDLAAEWLDVPIALMTLLDDERQWFKSCVGLDYRETRRDISFCVHNLDDEELLVVENASNDPRFADNPLVTGPPHIRFYAGAPLVTPNEHILGSLCVIDTTPRSLSDPEADALQSLAAIAVDELELRAARGHHETVLESITDAFYALDETWAFTYVNAEAERLLQRSREELLGKNVWEMFPEAAELELYDAYHRAVREQESTQLEMYYPPLDLWVLVNAYPFEGGLSVYFQDITQRVQAEKKQRIWAQAMEQAEEAIMITEGAPAAPPGPRITHVNSAFESLTNYSPDEIIGETPRLLQGPDTDPDVQDHVQSCLETGQPVEEVTAIYYRKDGSPFWVSWNMAPVRDEAGTIQCWVSTLHDVTPQRKMEEALRQRKQYLSVTLNSIGDAVIATDRQGCITEMNHVAETLTGWSSDEATGLPLADIFFIHNATTGDPVPNPVNKVLEDGETVGLANHTVLTARDGTERQIADSAAPIRSDDGALLGVVLVFRDVTEEYEQQRALKIERERFQMALTGANLGLWDLNMNTGETIFNERWAEMLGYTLEEVECSESFFIQHAHPDDTARLQEATKRHARGEIPHIDQEIRMQTKDGSWRWILSRGKILEWNEDGTPRRMVGTHLDITDRHEAQHTQARLAAIVESSQNAIIGADTEGYIHTWNDAAASLYGYSEDEVLGQSIAMLVPPDRHDEFEQEIMEPLRNGHPVGPLETVRQRKDGTRFDGLLSVAPIRQDKTGNVEGIAGTLIDITAQKQREQELRHQRNLLDQTQRLAGAWEFDLTSGIVSWSEEIYRIHELPPSETIQIQDAIRFYAPDAQPVISEAVERAIEEETPWDLELPLITAKGNHRWVRAVGAPVEKKNGEVVKLAGAFQDITDRKQAEEELRRERDLLKRIFDTSPVTILTLDANRRITFVNSQVETLLSRAPAELVGKRFTELGWTVATPEGQPFPEEDLPFTQVLQSGTALSEVELAIDGPNGNRRLLSVSGAPLESINGDPKSAVFVIDDITEQRRAERQLLEAKETAEAAQATAEEMNRLKSALLANMSHEIRTPLTSIIGFSEVLVDMDLAAPADEFTRLIHNGGQRLLDTLNSVLDLSQLEAGAFQLHPEPVDVVALTQSLVTSFMHQAQRANVDVRVHPPEANAPSTPLTAHLDLGALQRVLSNLISNAIKFTGEGTMPGGTVDVVLNGDADTVTIKVVDTGIGIAPEFLPDLFSAFKQESTGDARQFEGNGLGLAITNQLVDLMNGTIEVASTKGEGTTFTVTLPRE